MTPAPATEEAIDAALVLHAGGATFKATLERLLLDLDRDQADALMLLLKESRGAWALLLGGQVGRALFVGNALSGTVTALGGLGWQVLVVDRCPARLRFAAARDEHATPGQVERVLLGGDARLPFAQGAFDLVVQEGEVPGPATGWAHDMAELARVARGERVLVADNRLAYKRSTGQRGQFHKPGPVEWLRGVARPARGERSLAGYRRLMGGTTRAFSLYPHAREFSHVVALDAPRPQLTVGPKERANRIKVIGHKLGLFPWLTPSFALLADAPAAPRLERVLDRLAQELDEPRPELDVLIATRSNTAVVLTGEADRPGGWVLHAPLNPNKVGLLRTHARFLRELPARFPRLPLPQLLFEGEVEGVYLTVERRLGGLSAPQITGDVAATRRLFLDASRHMASLTLGQPRPMDEQEFERLIGQRFALVRELGASRATARAVDFHLAALREVLVGRDLQRVVYHADLRGKHVQVTPEGRVLGLLDWGASEDEFLPYVDLLHLVVHQRKQEDRARPAGAWTALKAGDLRAHEREALDDYAGRLGLDADLRRVLEAAYPLLVAGMAERNWDYSRPRWVERQYGLDGASE